MAKPRKSLKAKSPQKKVATNDQMKDGKTKKKKYDYKNFKMYIYRVLKQVHSDKGMSKEAMVVVNDLMFDVFERLANEASQLAILKKNTKKQKFSSLTSRELQSAVRFHLPGELGRHAQNEGLKAMQKYFDSKTNE